jgi:hypothetical protein
MSAVVIDFRGRECPGKMGRRRRLPKGGVLGEGWRMRRVRETSKRGQRPPRPGLMESRPGQNPAIRAQK